MTFVDAITTLSDRLLRERTFDLVVAPAIADLQHDERATGWQRLRNRGAVLSAFIWGVYEDITSTSAASTFAALALIPMCYYSLLVTVCLPRSKTFDTPNGRLMVAGIILILSLGPVIACYWPERRQRRLPTETP